MTVTHADIGQIKLLIADDHPLANILPAMKCFSYTDTELIPHKNQWFPDTAGI